MTPEAIEALLREWEGGYDPRAIWDSKESGFPKACPVCEIPIGTARSLEAAREALADLLRVEPYVYEGRLEASLTVLVDTWEKLRAALALIEGTP